MSSRDLPGIGRWLKKVIRHSKLFGLCIQIFIINRKQFVFSCKVSTIFVQMVYYFNVQSHFEKAIE